MELEDRVNAVLRRALGEAVMERLGVEAVEVIQHDLAKVVQEHVASQLSAQTSTTRKELAVTARDAKGEGAKQVEKPAVGKEDMVPELPSDGNALADANNSHGNALAATPDADANAAAVKENGSSDTAQADAKPQRRRRRGRRGRSKDRRAADGEETQSNDKGAAPAGRHTPQAQDSPAAPAQPTTKEHPSDQPTQDEGEHAGQKVAPEAEANAPALAVTTTEEEGADGTTKEDGQEGGEDAVMAAVQELLAQLRECDSALTAANALASLRARLDASVAGRACEAGAVEITLDALHSTGNAGVARVQALHVLASLLSHRTGRERLAAHPHGLDTLLTFQRSANNVQRTVATKLLHLMAGRKRLVPVLVRKGALVTAAEALRAAEGRADDEGTCLLLLARLAGASAPPASSSKAGQQLPAIVDATISAMRRAPERLPVQEAGCTVLRCFGRQADTSSVVQALVQALVNHPSSKTVQEHAFEVLCGALQAKGNPKLRDILLEHRVIPTVLALLQRGNQEGDRSGGHDGDGHNDDGDGDGDDSTAKDKRRPEGGRPRQRRRGGRRHRRQHASPSGGASPVLVANCLLVLALSLQRFGDNKLTAPVFHERTVTSILRHMQQQPRAKGMQREALRLLAALTRSRGKGSKHAPELCGAVVDHDGAKAAAAAMQACLDSSDAQLFGCHLFLNLMDAYKANQRSAHEAAAAVVSADVVRRTVAAINKHPQTTVLVRSACTLLSKAVAASRARYGATGTTAAFASGRTGADGNSGSSSSTSSSGSASEQASAAPSVPSTPPATTTALAAVNEKDAVNAAMHVLQGAGSDRAMQGQAISLLVAVCKTPPAVRAATNNRALPELLNTLQQQLLRDRIGRPGAKELLLTLAEHGRAAAFVQAGGLKVLAAMLEGQPQERGSRSGAASGGAGGPGALALARAGVKALGWLAGNERCREHKTFKQTLVPAVLRLMKQRARDADMQSACMSVLREAEGVPQAQLLDHVIATMQRHPARADVQASAVGILRNIALSGPDELLKRGMVDDIVGVLKEHEGHAGVAEQACGALCNLAVHKACRRKIVRAGGIEATLETMRKHVVNAAVQEHGCRVLWNLAVDPAPQELIGTLGGIGQIVDAMLAHPESEAVQEAGCGALGNLALSATNRIRVETPRTANALRAAAKAFSDNPVVGKQVDGLLARAAAAALEQEQL